MRFQDAAKDGAIAFVQFRKTAPTRLIAGDGVVRQPRSAGVLVKVAVGTGVLVKVAVGSGVLVAVAVL